jgi:hypothetical protein
MNIQKVKVHTTKMEVDKNRICPHEILSEDCSKCQLLTFCRVGLLKAVTKNIIAPFVKEGDNFWIFTIRPCADYEEGIKRSEVCGGEMNDDYEYKYGGLVFLGKDGWLSKEVPEGWPIYKIVFKGTFEALIGFICCFIMKYGQLSILPHIGATVHEDYKDINTRLKDIWQRGGEFHGCIFERCPAYDKAYQTYDPDGKNQYFATNNIEEFMAGYREMADIFIPDVDFYKDGYTCIDGIGPIEYFVHERDKRHCCKDPDIAEGCHSPINEREMESDISNGNVVLPKCKAYFYKL